MKQGAIYLQKKINNTLHLSTHRGLANAINMLKPLGVVGKLNRRGSVSSICRGMCGGLLGCRGGLGSCNGRKCRLALLLLFLELVQPLLQRHLKKTKNTHTVITTLLRLKLELWGCKTMNDRERGSWELGIGQNPNYVASQEA